MVRPQHLLYIFMGVYPCGGSMAVKHQGSWPMLFSYWAYHWWSLKSRGLYMASTLDFSYTSRHLSLNPYPSPIIPKQLVDTSKRHRWSWRDGSMVRVLYVLPGVPCSIPRTLMTAHNHLQLQFQGVRCPLPSISTEHACGTQTYRQARHPDT